MLQLQPQAISSLALQTARLELEHQSPHCSWHNSEGVRMPLCRDYFEAETSTYLRAMAPFLVPACTQTGAAVSWRGFKASFWRADLNMSSLPFGNEGGSSEKKQTVGIHGTCQIRDKWYESTVSSLLNLHRCPCPVPAPSTSHRVTSQPVGKSSDSHG